jgi:hypothetical protein
LRGWRNALILGTGGAIRSRTTGIASALPMAEDRYALFIVAFR